MKRVFLGLSPCTAIATVSVLFWEPHLVWLLDQEKKLCPCEQGAAISHLITARYSEGQKAKGWEIWLAKQIEMFLFADRNADCTQNHRNFQTTRIASHYFPLHLLFLHHQPFLFLAAVGLKFFLPEAPAVWDSLHTSAWTPLLLSDLVRREILKNRDTNLEAGIKLYSSAEIRGVRQIIFQMSGTNVLLFFLHAVSLSLCCLLSFSSTKLCLTLGKAIEVGIRSNVVCTGVCG